jgi:hypothetical protein
MHYSDWRDEAERIILHPGDIIIDIINGQVGVLVKMERRITAVDDDLYFWDVMWSAGDALDATSAVNPMWMEERSLKLSIIVGFYDLYSGSIEKD